LKKKKGEKAAPGGRSTGGGGKRKTVLAESVRMNLPRGGPSAGGGKGQKARLGGKRKGAPRNLCLEKKVTVIEGRLDGK